MADPQPTPYRDWIGREEERIDRATLAPVKGLLALFDDEETHLGEGDPIPPLWHWLYFLPQAPQSQIGHDGHPKRGGFLPPITLPRRMFAGGQLRFHRNIAIGDALARKGRITDVVEKHGKSGALVFVTVLYEIYANDTLAIEEQQTIVYRDAGTEQTPPLVPAPEWTPLAPEARHSTLVADPVVLFRFSALTFNGHRIHYDRDYAMSEEGYPGLIVHGPLLALSLLELVRRHHMQPVRKFSFRGEAPVFDGQEVRFEAEQQGAGLALRARRIDNRIAMSASVSEPDPA